MLQADELLADADVARSLGQKAVDKAEETLKEANNTLKTLKGHYHVQNLKQHFDVLMRRSVL